jgi:hypothetical protein
MLEPQGAETLDRSHTVYTEVPAPARGQTTEVFKNHNSY